MPSHFLYLEICDPEINALVLAITEITNGVRPSSPPHLTIRGPYDGGVPKKTLEMCRKAMKYDVIKISNIGRFSNPSEEVVYFQVDSVHLRSIWYKPTYLMSKFGFNPHISVYRGKDSQWAEILTNFLKCEDIELLCAEFRLVPHLTQQLALLPSDVKVYESFPRLLASGRVHPTFLARLEDLAKEYKSQKESPIKKQIPLI